MVVSMTFAADSYGYILRNVITFLDILPCISLGVGNVCLLLSARTGACCLLTGYLKGKNEQMCKLIRS